MKNVFNGLRVHRVPTFVGAPTTTIFVPLPRSAWAKIEGGCKCEHCKADPTEAYWDTLAIGSGSCRTWTVHRPEQHPEKLRDAAEAEKEV